MAIAIVVIKAITPGVNSNILGILHAVGLNILAECNLADSKANSIHLLFRHTKSSQLGEDFWEGGSFISAATDVNYFLRLAVSIKQLAY